MKRSRIGTMMFAMLVLASCSRGSESEAASISEGAGSQAPEVHTFAASNCPELTCHGSLVPGAYRSTILDPTIDFEITSPGWTWDFSAGGFRILANTSHEDLHSPDGIYFLRKPAIASQDCEETTEPRVGRSVSELVSWLASAPGLETSDPTPVTIGGLDGEQIDLQLDPQWKGTCSWSNKLPVVPLIFRGTAIGGYNLALILDASMRWYVLDSPDGVIVVDVEDGPGGVSHDELFQTGGEIVQSLAFS